MIRSVALLVVLFSVSLPLSASAEKRRETCVMSFWNRGAEPAAETPPAGFDEALLRKALSVEGMVCGWAVKPWGRDGQLYVAVVEQNEALSIGVFEKGESIALRARSRVTFSKFDRAYFHHFDFAPYRINSKETAIGLRLAKSVAYAGGGGTCESISLFRLQEDQLALVFYGQIDYSAMVRGDPIEAGGPSAVHDVAAAATLSISDNETNGFYDYVRSVKMSIPWDDRTQWKTTYIWGDGHYEPKGEAEPLESNCLIPDFDMALSGPDRTQFPAWRAY